MTTSASARLALRSVRDGLVAGIAILGIAALCGYIVYLEAAKGLKEEVQHYLLSIATTASVMTDGDLHQTVQNPEDKYNAAYTAIQAPYKKILEANPSIAFIYTTVLKGNGVHLVIDTQPQKPGQVDDTAAVMEAYDDATDAMKAALSEHKPKVEDDFYTDKWGTFMSGYVPIYNSSKQPVGIVGVDITVEQYLAHLASIRMSLYTGIALTLIIAIALGAAVGWLRYAARMSDIRSAEQNAQLARMEGEQKQNDARQEQTRQRELTEQRRALAKDFDESVHAFMHTVSSSADNIASVTRDIVGTTSQSAGKTRDVAGIIQATSQRVQSLNHMVSGLSQAVASIGGTIVSGGEIVEQGVQRTEETQTFSNNLTQAVSSLDSMISLINGIANQINLLALNATIEAARAGDAGKGFSVVASEVKNLARQTQETLKNMEAVVGNVKNLSDQTAQKIVEVQDVIRNVEDAYQSMLTVTREQQGVIEHITGEVRQISEGTEQVSVQTTTVSQYSDNTVTQAQSMAKIVQTLGPHIQQLNQQMEKFVKALATGS